MASSVVGILRDSEPVLDRAVRQQHLESIQSPEPIPSSKRYLKIES